MSTNSGVKAVHGDLLIKLDSVENMKGSVLISEEINISAATD